MQGLATFRLSTSPLHRHCYSSQQDELRTRIAGQVRVRAHSPASVRTGPAGIPVRGCVDVRAHTLEGRDPRAYRSFAPLPPALPSSSSSLSPQFRTVGKKFAPNCPTDPSNKQTLTHFGLVFRSPQTLGVCGELTSNISRPVGTRACGFVCVEAREEIFHT